MLEYMEVGTLGNFLHENRHIVNTKFIVSRLPQLPTSRLVFIDQIRLVPFHARVECHVQCLFCVLLPEIWPPSNLNLNFLQP
jgi:hypothetical protein